MKALADRSFARPSPAGLLALVLLAMVPAWPLRAALQVPDTIPVRDTIPVPDDEDEDVPEIVPRNLPLVPGGLPALGAAAVWEWDREALLASPALTLHDLLSFVPGVTMLRGGDHGTPVAVTAFGLGPGQIRVVRDGMEVPPQEGGVVDLAAVGLAGIERVRIERGVTEVRIHLQTLRLADARPYTLLDVGTGDLRTNMFRATFAHPSVLAGTLMLALDRVDTDGPFRELPGAAFGTHFRYTHFRGDRGGVALDYRSRTTRRSPDFYTPRSVERKDLTVRTGWTIVDGVVAEGWASRSTVELGRETDPASDTLLPEGTRRQIGARVGWEWEGFWARAGYRQQAGRGWPSSVLGLEGGAAREGLGGAAVAWEREGWRDGGPGTLTSARAWTAPFAGISLFGEVQDSKRGVPFMVPRTLPPEEEENGDPTASIGSPAWTAQEEGDEEEPPAPLRPRLAERSGLRVGARAGWRGAALSAALIRVEADSLHPMGLPFDRDGVTLAGGTRSAFELEGDVPLPFVLEGLRLHGSMQLWEDAEAWRYLPQRSWTGALSWHTVGYDESLEVWADLGVRGRDPMLLPITDGVDQGLASAPFTQSWYARLQFRVVSVRVFVQWENFTVKDDNREFPDLIQPPTRVMYGIRWIMWN